MKLESLITLAALAAAAFLVTSGAKARSSAAATPSYTSFFGRSIGNFGGDPTTVYWPGAGLASWNLQPISLTNPYGTFSL